MNLLASRAFALVDCDAFFVSCERLRNTSLQNRPTIVMSSNDGCAISCSREAKALGIHVGVPIFQVRNLIKQHKIATISSDFRYYGELSAQVMECLKDLCPQMEIYSIDEAFLSMVGLRYDELAAHGNLIYQTVLKQTGIPVSVGFGPTMTLAKVAVNYAKTRKISPYPKVFVLHPSGVKKYLQTFPLQKIWGIGRRFAPKLMAQGILTAGHLVSKPDSWIKKHMGIVGKRLVCELRGIPCRDLQTSLPQKKSLVVSRTFGSPIFDQDTLMSAIATFAARIGEKLRKRHLVAQNLAIFAKSSPHISTPYKSTKMVTLFEATNNTSTFIHALRPLVAKIYSPKVPFRKAGVCVLNLHREDLIQPSLFQPQQNVHKQHKINTIVDLLNRRFGPGTLRYGEEGVKQLWASKSTNPGNSKLEEETAFTDLNLRFH